MAKEYLRYPTVYIDELAAELKRRGGLLHPAATEAFAITNALEKFEMHSRYAREKLYLDKPRPLEFAILGDTNIGAFAYASDENSPPFDFIGVNQGVIYTAWDTFTRILAHPGTFPDVGQPDKEEATRTFVPHLTTNVLFAGFKPVTPRCTVRSRYALELMNVFLDFIFFHELTHLTSGHLEFLRANLKTTSHGEAATQTEKFPDVNRILQTLEIDADCGGILLSLNNAFLHKTYYEQNVPDAEKMRSFVESAYGSPKCCARLVHYAAYMFFRIFDIPEWYEHLQSQHSHPFPPLRMSFVGSTLYEIFKERPSYQYSSDEYLADSAEFTTAAERDCTLIQDAEVNNGSILSAFKKSIDVGYVTSFTACWRQIRPELEKYKRGGKLAP